jgi:hypothetical protein
MKQSNQPLKQPKPNQDKDNSKPKLKPQQAAILILLYRFRFLNRIHIQTLLGHKYHSRIFNWLDWLVKEQYLKRDYDKRFTSAPAVYSLAPLGRKYLKDNLDIEPVLLSRIWREKTLTPEFRDHCLFLADIYLSLISLTSKTKAKLHFYTKTDLSGMKCLIVPAPDAYVAIEEESGEIKRYFLDIFDDIPPKFLRRRVNQYFTYYDLDEWQDSTNKPFPTVLLICPTKRMKNHL